MSDATKPIGLALLREPFPAHQISKLPKPYKADSPKGKCAECGGYHGLPAVHLDYVGHAALTDRLLDCDKAWDWQPLAFTPDGLPAMDKIGGMWIKLTICGVTRLGYGHPDGKNGGNAIKEVIGDALRNAAMRFGAALDLWHKGDLHGDDDEGPMVGPNRDMPPPDAPKTPPTPAQIADKMLLRFGEFTTIQQLMDFTDPDQPAGKAWETLGRDAPDQAARVKAAFDRRKAELEKAQ